MLTISGLAQSDVFDAARSGNVETIKALHKENPEIINSANTSGHSPLIIAAYNNQEEVVHYLLEAGADVNYQFNQGAAIHGAAFKGHYGVVVLLVEYNAKFDVPDQNGTTPLIYATLFGHIDVAKFLFAKGSNPRLKDNTEQSAVDYARQLKHEDLIELFESK